MAIQLVVVQPFGAHLRGDRVTDADQVAAILAGDLARHVVAVAVAESLTAKAPKKASEE